MKVDHRFFLLLVTMGVLGVGCAVGPRYEKPAATSIEPVPEDFRFNATITNHWKQAEPGSHPGKTNWWLAFGNADLNRLQSDASTNNQQLVAAMERIEQARALFKVSRSSLFPDITAGASFTRQRTSLNSFDRGQASGVSHTYNSFSAPLEAQWELDLWGRVRNQTSASRARFEASQEDLEALKLALHSEVAADFISSQALEAEYDFVKQTVEAYRRSLALTQNRRQGGIASDLDVSQAQTQLRTSEALLPRLELEKIQAQNALATLCGHPAPTFQVFSNRNFTLPIRHASIPSELLEHRPDIAAAEKRMIAANAEIGVATAAFYPRVTFRGLAGLQSVDAASWFDWPSRVWAFGPSIDLPIFSGGRNKAQLAFARAGYRETVANYRQTVLGAFEEVQNQLAAQELLDQELVAQQAAAAAAQQTWTIAENRYKAGLVTFLEVASAQTTALDRQRTVTRLQGQRFIAAVSLIKSLGGWAE